MTVKLHNFPLQISLSVEFCDTRKLRRFRRLSPRRKLPHLCDPWGTTVCDMAPDVPVGASHLALGVKGRLNHPVIHKVLDPVTSRIPGNETEQIVGAVLKANEGFSRWTTRRIDWRDTSKIAWA